MNNFKVSSLSIKYLKDKSIIKLLDGKIELKNMSEEKKDQNKPHIDYLGISLNR